jgi:hypothetical protein
MIKEYLTAESSAKVCAEDRKVQINYILCDTLLLKNQNQILIKRHC